MSHKPVMVLDIAPPNYEPCTPAGRAAARVLKLTEGIALPAHLIERMILNATEEEMSKPTPETHLEDSGILSESEKRAMLQAQFDAAVEDGYQGDFDTWVQEQWGNA